jgi:hypothetical protein
MARNKERLIIDIQGKQIPVMVDSTGVFWAEWEGDSFRSETFKGLRVKLLPKVRVDAKRCERPAMLRSYGGEWEYITLVGIHGDNGNVLYTDAERKTHQLSRRDRRVFRVLSDAELRELKKLEAAVDAARDKVNAWLKPRLMEPGKVVRQAIGLPPEKNRDEPIDDNDDWT